MELGGRFWLGLVGVVIGAGLAAMLLFLFIGWAWAAWGFFGMLVVFGGLLLGIGRLYDRREQRRYEQLPE